LSLGQNAQSQQTSKVLSEKIDIKKINTLKAQFECFVRCIEHNEPCPTSPQDAYAAMEIAFKIMKKIESLGAS
jgi:predicted dehydrogenase